MAETPVGDYIRRRYPDNPREIHWLGSEDDPGCCGGPHPACTYIAAFAEGAAAEREHAQERTRAAMERFSRTAELAQAKAIEVAVAKERERWRAALADALDGMEDMFGYVPEFFREKWDHQGYLDRAHAMLREGEPDA